MSQMFFEGETEPSNKRIPIPTIISKQATCLYLPGCRFCQRWVSSRDER